MQEWEKGKHCSSSSSSNSSSRRRRRENQAGQPQSDPGEAFPPRRSLESICRISWRKRRLSCSFVIWTPSQPLLNSCHRGGLLTLSWQLSKILAGFPCSGTTSPPSLDSPDLSTGWPSPGLTITSPSGRYGFGGRGDYDSIPVSSPYRYESTLPEHEVNCTPWRCSLDMNNFSYNGAILHGQAKTWPPWYILHPNGTDAWIQNKNIQSQLSLFLTTSLPQTPTQGWSMNFWRLFHTNSTSPWCQILALCGVDSQWQVAGLIGTQPSPGSSKKRFRVKQI